MAAPKKLTTIVSTKGQVTLPKTVRERQHWSAGTRLIVEETDEGVVLKSAPHFAPNRPEDVYGCLRHEGKAKTLEEMDMAVTAELKARHARGRS